MPAPKFTEASLKNVIGAVAAAGLTPTAMLLQPDGSLRMEFLSEQLSNVANSEPSMQSAEAPKKWGGKR